MSLGNKFSPNKKYEYSNSNYVILTFIAEDVSKKTFSDLLNEIIVNTCKLTNTGLGSTINAKNNEALSYSKGKNWKIESETDMSIPLGAGAIVSTPHDLNIFLNHLFNNKLISKSSVELMKTIKEGYGLGLIKAPFYNTSGYGHTGGIDGFQSNAIYFPSEKVSVAFTSNAIAYPMNNILIGVLSIYFGKEYLLPIFKKPLELKSEELDKYIGVYSDSSFPLKITISKEENVLKAQATGQSQFSLDCYELHTFKFEPAMLTLVFNPENNIMVLKQGGKSYELKKE